MSAKIALRVVLTVFVLAVCFIVTQVLEQKVLPGRAADLAIEQLEENGAREQLRIEQNAQNWLDPVAYLITLVFIGLVWYKPMKEMNKKFEEKLAGEVEKK